MGHAKLQCRLRASVALPAGCVLVALCSIRAECKTWSITEQSLGEMTIQQAIATSADGDTILVGAGRYLENIDFSGKDIVVQSESGPDVTIIDGSSQQNPVVRFSGGGSDAGVLEGFTITGGTGLTVSSGGSRLGGGIYIEDAEPKIRNNWIIENTAIGLNGGGAGGGIHIVSIGSVIRRPVISHNRIVENRSGTIGGGIEATGSVAPVIVFNEVVRNESVDGGGMQLWLCANGAIISGNLIKGNTASDHGGGVVVGVTRDLGYFLEAEVSWNMIIENRALAEAQVQSSGGGLFMSFANTWVHHNTFYGNSGHGGNGSWGGSIAIAGEGFSTVELNIISHSKVGVGIHCVDSSRPTISRNLAWANADGAGSGSCQDWTLENDNLVADPYYCDLGASSFAVATNSPALTYWADPTGAEPVPGCGPVTVSRTTWGLLKSMYQSEE